MITKDKVEKILKDSFHPEYIFVGDDSFRHAGHAEAALSGGKHFSVTIVSNKFAGTPLVKRHQMIYEALKSEMKQEIHALAIKAWTPEEYKKQNKN